MADLGRDISVFPDLGKRFRIVSGRRCLAEDLLKRITTPRGKLHYAPDYGIDVRDFLNDAITADKLKTIRAAIVAECAKDERVLSVVASVTFDETTRRLTIQLAVATVDGSFKLIVAADANLVELLRVE